MYEDVGPNAELRQGGLFDSLPWPVFDPSRVYLGGALVNLAETGFVEPQVLALPAEPAPGVIVSADCDAVRKEDLLVARVRPLISKYPGYEAQSPANRLRTKVKVWKGQGTFFLQARESLPDSFIEVSEVQVLPRTFLLDYRRFRLATLTEPARRHLREKMASFLTRYGADEAYFLTPDELQEASR